MRLVDRVASVVGQHPIGRVRRTERLAHDALGDVGGAVARVEREVPVGVPAHEAVDPVGVTERAVQRARVGVDEQLVRVEPVPLSRCVGSVHAVAVALPRAESRDVAVPDVVGPGDERVARGLPLAALVEQAELDAGRVRREQREVDAAVPRDGAERVGAGGGGGADRAHALTRRRSGRAQEPLPGAAGVIGSSFQMSRL